MHQIVIGHALISINQIDSIEKINIITNRMNIILTVIERREKIVTEYLYLMKTDQRSTKEFSFLSFILLHLNDTKNRCATYLNEIVDVPTWTIYFSSFFFCCCCVSIEKEKERMYLSRLDLYWTTPCSVFQSSIDIEPAELNKLSIVFSFSQGSYSIISIIKHLSKKDR